MAQAGPRKIQRYSLEFRLTAVRLSQLPGVEVQTVAAALWLLDCRASRPRRVPFSERGLLARDVDRLVHLARHLPRKRVPPDGRSPDELP